MINTKILNEILNDIKKIFRIRDKKKFVLENLPYLLFYLLFFYIGNIFASHVNSYVGGDILDRVIVAFSQIDGLNYIPSFKIKNLIPGLILALGIKLILIQKKKKAKSLERVENMDQQDGGMKKTSNLTLTLSLKTM